MAVSAFHDDRNGEPSDMKCDPHSLHLLSEVVAKTAPFGPNSVPKGVYQFSTEIARPLP